MVQELFPVGMGHTSLLWDVEPKKISYREELLILEGPIGEVLLRHAQRGCGVRKRFPNRIEGGLSSGWNSVQTQP